MASAIRVRTVKLFGGFLKPLCEEGLLTVAEQNEILSQLRHLAEKGDVMPAV